MNEWLSEKSDARLLRTEPLEVAVEESMFVTCLPSPRNSMDRLRRNSSASACVPRERSASLNVENSAGSAKKVGIHLCQQWNKFKKKLFLLGIRII